MDASYAAGPTPVQHDAGQHVQWQLHADQAYDAGSYPNLAALSVNTTSPPPTQQQVQYHQFQYNPLARRLCGLRFSFSPVPGFVFALVGLFLCVDQLSVGRMLSSGSCHS
ncbi:hypothetical protein EXIGLDRAFT_777309 [Exidia glandulosa HHB12029]|uniref:Uncharacterized protein n=1 Tax=Exidia glandulosa HHB12029 TaxID=1314781 RepID=A0A165D3N2_EXIGL|nr:hypothetical protein EXIGLDRAFT_777309 [Exidia glandulosa HHB12029]